MIVIPAIDLRDGKCVRLFQGDYDQTTVFADRPVEVAERWAAAGAKWLHVVDLDGASSGQPVNLALIGEIVAAIGIPVQVGGGIRTLETIERVLGMGVKRVFLGTAAVEDSELVAGACRQFGEAIAVAVDARNGFVATRGWRQGTAVSAVELVKRVRDLGVPRVLYTDISRDGTLTEPNYEALREVMAASDASVIASGGVSSVEHLIKLSALGVEGAIVGKALYTGDISLSDAIARVE